MRADDQTSTKVLLSLCLNNAYLVTLTFHPFTPHFVVDKRLWKMEHLIKISIWISLILILSTFHFFKNIFLNKFNFYFDFLGGVEGFPTNNDVQSQIPSQNSYYMRPYYYYPQPHYYHHPTFWYPPKMPSPPLPRTPQVPQVPQVPQMSQPLTQPPQPPELMGCANSPSCSSACLKVWNKMKSSLH